MSQYIIVPQHQPTAKANFQPNPPAIFTSHNGSIRAINVEAACSGHIPNLDNANNPCIVGQNRRISVIVHWPGLPEWKFLDMSVCHYDGNATPRTHMEILGTLSDVIHTFYEDMKSHSVAPDTDSTWDLRRIPFNALYVSELRQVHSHRWQPALWVQSNVYAGER